MFLPVCLAEEEGRGKVASLCGSAARWQPALTSSSSFLLLLLIFFKWAPQIAAMKEVLGAAAWGAAACMHPAGEEPMRQAVLRSFKDESGCLKSKGKHSESENSVPFHLPQLEILPPAQWGLFRTSWAGAATQESCGNMALIPVLKP